jgi:hypothetical protein
MAINQSLAAAGQVPVDIQVSISPRQPLGRAVVLRSQHEFRPRLLESDHDKIDHAIEIEAKCAQVPLSDYLRPSAKEGSSP